MICSPDSQQWTNEEQKHNNDNVRPIGLRQKFDNAITMLNRTAVQKQKLEKAEMNLLVEDRNKIMPSERYIIHVHIDLRYNRYSLF